MLSLLTHEWAKCHDVVVAAFDASRPAYDYHGRIVHLGLRLPGHALARIYVACASTLLLIKLFRTERPDRVITFMEPANFPAILASALLGTLDRPRRKCASESQHALFPTAPAHPPLVPPPVSGGCSLRRRPTRARGDGLTHRPRHHHTQPGVASRYFPPRCHHVPSRPLRAGCRTTRPGQGVRHTF